MSFLVLAYPKVSEQDFEWIQNIRAKYDSRFYNVVNPHFTIVFPVINIEEEKFINYVQHQSTNCKKIKFICRCAVIVKDSFSEFTDIFLVPDEGYSEIVKLHDRLYSGLLKENLRLDIPFIPHIAVASSLGPFESKKICDGLNKLNFSIKGILDKLDVVFYEYPEIKSIKEVSLI